jgi:hypothetical protein
MRVKSLFTLAALIAMTAVAAVAYLILPDRAWNSTSVAALCLFAAAIGSTFYAPFSLPSYGKGRDASLMGSIGPAGLIVAGLVGWSGITFIVALTGRGNVAWAMMVATVAGYVVSVLVLKASAQIIDKHAAQTSGPSKRNTWTSAIEDLASSTADVTVRSALEDLSEKFRFSASDVPDSGDSFDGPIGENIEELSAGLQSAEGGTDKVLARIHSISLLLDRRETKLKAARSKS